jgi:selenide,water dikinase
LGRIPLLEGALETSEKGILSSLQPQNLQALQAIANASTVNTHPYFPLLFDPQTSGGLLASVPIEESDRCLAALHALGYTHSAIVGYTTPLSDQAKPITIV